jgi:hypothetical protein
MIELDREEYFSEEEYQIDVRREQIKQLQAEIRGLQSDVPWICPNCDYHNLTKHSTLHLYEYYVPPYSCAGGDYYTPEKYARIQCDSCEHYMQFLRAELDIPTDLFLRILTHKTGG